MTLSRLLAMRFLSIFLIMSFSSIKCLHQNIQSLRHKVHDAEAYCLSHDIDILVLSETHLDDTIFENQLLIGDYILFRKDRKSNGGGVAIYCKSFLRPRSVEIVSDLEILAVDVTISGKNLRVVGIYLPVFSPAQKIAAIEKLEMVVLSELGNCR